MARIKRTAQPAPPAGIPPELLDPRHDVWRENESTDYWRAVAGLPGTPPVTTIRAQPMPGDPPSPNFGKGGRVRHHRAVSDWARANGYTRTDHPGWVDYRRLRELGLLTPIIDGRVS